MTKGRLEAFSDGVIAIIITIMVLELRPPGNGDLSSLLPLLPKIISYILSFVFLSIYWNNHHHLLQAAKKVNGAILWANMHLLFWLSLVPFVTGWMGENNFGKIPVALYGLVLWMSAMAFYILVRTLITFHGEKSLIATALGNRAKELTSLGIYTLAILLAFYVPIISTFLYAVVAAIWLVPDRRIEDNLYKQ